jgi:hypothetical protein
MTIPELEAQLLALTPTEKAHIIQLLTQNLANTWQGINKTPVSVAVMLVSDRLAFLFGCWRAFVVWV